VYEQISDALKVSSQFHREWVEDGNYADEMQWRVVWRSLETGEYVPCYSPVFVG
jgi:hypothetical protein